MDVHVITIREDGDCDVYNEVRRFIGQINVSFGTKNDSVIEIEQERPSDNIIVVRMSSLHASLLSNHGDIVDVKRAC